MKLGALLLLSSSLVLAACTAGSPTSEGESTQAAVTRAENPDRESDDAVAAAKESVLKEFGHLTDADQVRAASLPNGYGHLDPDHLVPRDLLATAVTYFDQNKDSFPNKSYLTVVDFKPSSDKYRFFLVDLTSGSVERYHTTHGLHSDEDDDGLAESFGNVEGSGKSSLGFVRTAEVYTGTYRRSIRLDGLSTTNSNIRSRAIVFHGWVETHESNVKQGLSWGCITLDYAVKDAVLDKIKEGSLMYVGVSK